MRANIVTLLVLAMFYTMVGIGIGYVVFGR